MRPLCAGPFRQSAHLELGRLEDLGAALLLRGEQLDGRAGAIGGRARRELGLLARARGARVAAGAARAAADTAAAAAAAATAAARLSLRLRDGGLLARLDELVLGSVERRVERDELGLEDAPEVRRRRLALRDNRLDREAAGAAAGGPDSIAALLAEEKGVRRRLEPLRGEEN